MLRTPNRPAEAASAVTASDSANIPVTRGIYVGGAGNLRVMMADGTDILFSNLAAGVAHPLAVVRVYATNTTATGIIALR
jgi:hypothetical protein